MNGALLTRATIWLALAAWAAGAGALLQAKTSSRWRAPARWLWTLACACYLAHVLCAFGFFHHWSHAAAYRETARQTRETVGWAWGGGLFVNYLFTLAWVADTAWWWLQPARHEQRAPRLTALWHGLLFFLVFNGAVVFGHGPVRWFGAALCLGVLLLWRRAPGSSGSAAAPPARS